MGSLHLATIHYLSFDLSYTYISDTLKSRLPFNCRDVGARLLHDFYSVMKMRECIVSSRACNTMSAISALIQAICIGVPYELS